MVTLDAVRADCAVLMVYAVDFEAGFAERSQAREHVMIARSVKINQLICCVNKMDQSAYSIC